MAIDGQQLCFVRLLGVLRDVLLVVLQQLPLQFQGASEVAVVDVHLHHFRHPAQAHIVAEHIHNGVHLQL